MLVKNPDNNEEAVQEIVILGVMCAVADVDAATGTIIPGTKRVHLTMAAGTSHVIESLHYTVQGAGDHVKKYWAPS